MTNHSNGKGCKRVHHTALEPHILHPSVQAFTVLMLSWHRERRSCSKCTRRSGAVQTQEIPSPVQHTSPRSKVSNRAHLSEKYGDSGAIIPIPLAYEKEGGGVLTAYQPLLTPDKYA